MLTETVSVSKFLTPPPLLLAMLPAIVLFVIVMLASLSISMPPPTLAVFPMIAQSLISAWPETPR